MDADRDLLRQILASETSAPIDRAASALVDAILGRHGDAVLAVILYGSCLRRGDPTAAADPVHDFYVLVDRYHRVYRNPVLALANRLLPPNVFYLEVPRPERRLRAKYAVVARAHFGRLLSRHAFHSYFWARFAQPVRLAYVRDAAMRTDLLEALVDAVITLASRVAGLVDGEITAAEFWRRAFSESYRAELRAERSERAQLLYESDRDRYDRLAAPALRAAGFNVRCEPGDRLLVETSARERRRAKGAWALRRAVGKLLSVLRIAKGIFTFDGGLDYILWKIERHSGIKADATAWQRRHPLLAAPGLAWRLYRLGAFR